MRLDELRTGLQAFLAHASRSSYSLAGNRVYYWPFPQGATLPLVTIARLPGSGYSRMGTRATPIDVDFQISAWSATLAEAEQVLSLILDDLDGYTGLLGSATIELSKLRTVNPEIYEPDSGLYQASADFALSYAP